MSENRLPLLDATVEHDGISDDVVMEEEACVAVVVDNIIPQEDMEHQPNDNNQGREAGKNDEDDDSKEKVQAEDNAKAQEEDTTNSKNHDDDDDDDDAEKKEGCLWCGRTPRQVEDEKKSSDLLPNGQTCWECDEPMYSKPDPNFREFEDGLTVLASLCEDSNWEAVFQRLQVFPNEVYDFCAEPSALHYACKNGAPLRLIEAIVQAGPLMLRSFPWENFDSPLDCLLTTPNRRGNLSKIKTLVKHDKDWKAVKLAVGTAWRVAKEKLGDEAVNGETFFFLSNASKEATEAWRNFCYLKKVAHYETLDVSGLSLLPALADCRYLYSTGNYVWDTEPALPLKLALQIFPNEVTAVDPKGNTLLHLACQGSKPVREKEDWESEDDDSSSGWTVKVFYEYENYNADKIKILLSAYPAAASVRNEAGDLPIHLAIKARKNWNILKSVHDAYPAGIERKDSDGNTCLHLAALMQRKVTVNCSYDWDETEDSSIIKGIGGLHRNAMTMKNNEGQVPLHIGLEKGKLEALDLVRYKKSDGMIYIKNTALRIRDNHGLLPLHVAAKCSIGGCNVSVLLKHYPRAATERDVEGKLPLHYVPPSSSHRAKIHHLLDAFPDGAKVADDGGKLPLHLINSKLLLRAYPRAARRADNSGKLPIHYHGDSLASAHYPYERDDGDLLKAYPDGAKKTDQEGRLPLHYHASQKLLDAYPDGAKTRDQEGQLPIHMEKNYSKFSALELLVKAYPGGAKVVNKEGLLPLHLVLNSKDINFPGESAIPVIKLLLDANPDAVKIADIHQGNLPLHIALKNSRFQRPGTYKYCASSFKYFAATIVLLMETNPGALIVPDSEKQREEGLLLYPFSLAAIGNYNYFGRKEHVDLIFKLLQANPTALAHSLIVHSKNNADDGDDDDDDVVKPPATKKQKVDG